MFADSRFFPGLDLPFTKMHGLGNDFVVLNAADLQPYDKQQLIVGWEAMASLWARALCDRHFGIGADALVVLFDLSEKGPKLPGFVERYPSSGKDQFAWTYTNSDGSWSKTCGNALRCSALYLTNRNLVPSGRFSISTAHGSMPIQHVDNQIFETDFGQPILDGREIPSVWSGKKCVAETIEVTCFDKPFKLTVTAVGFGNPHCVIFDDIRIDGKVVDRTDRETLGRIASFIQSSPYFPEGVNVEFANARTRDQVSLSVFERGCGWTLACGSGAAATLVAGVLENRIDRKCQISLPGGSALLTWNELDDHVLLRGPAREVFSGFLNIDHFADGVLVANLHEVAA